MCGVVGFIGNKGCSRLLYDGLKKLEYRGYDSSGLAVVEPGTISLVKSVGKLDKLEPLLETLPHDAKAGMGHTRWATHGIPSKENAHPHREQGLAIVHNGIIENFQELKIGLLERGKTFLSDTDSEVIVHLLHEELEGAQGSMRHAIHNLVGRLEGAYAIGVVSADHPDHVYVIKQGSPIALGIGEDFRMFASDALPIMSHTQKVLFLEDGEIAELSKDAHSVWNFSGQKVEREPLVINWDRTAAEKGGYRHYMLKEIHEQPAVLRQMLTKYVDFESRRVRDELLHLDKIDWKRVDRVLIVACGTAYIAGMSGQYILEEALHIPVSVELASEFRYRRPHINDRTLLISVTQSGETLDTLASVKYAKTFGCQTLCICNVEYSSIPRESQFTFYMEAGPEMGVASTKAFTAMVLSFRLLSLGLQGIYFAGDKPSKEVWEELKKLPTQMDQAFEVERSVMELAGNYAESQSAIFIGRGMSYPIAMEGALKLKEISYIHAEAYAGGELKHGPIALVDQRLPIIAISTQGLYREKMLSNIEEVCARDGNVLGVGPKNDAALERLCTNTLAAPQNSDDACQAILSIVPLQLLAYYVAVIRGTDVDQPRNLAKSVTVE